MADEIASEQAVLRRPSGATLPCAECGSPVDPLRAARVARFGERFQYFCSADCRSRYVPREARTPANRASRPPPAPATLAHGELVAADTTGYEAAEAFAAIGRDGIEDLSLRARIDADEDLEDEGSDEEPIEDDGPGLVAQPTDVGTLLIAIAVVASALAILLFLAGTSGAALTARTVLVAVAAGSVAARVLSPGRDPSEPHPAVLVFGPLSVMAAAVWARLAGLPEAASLVTTSALVTGGSAASLWLADWVRTPVDVERAHIDENLRQSGQRIVGDELGVARADDLRPGEEIVIDAGETVPVDATVSAGTAKVQPWFGATSIASRSEGDAIVAGSRVIDGRLRAIASWTGNDRAWMRLTHDARRRADIHAPLARLGRHLAERGSLAMAFVAGLAALSSTRGTVVALAFAGIAQAALGSGIVASIAALHSARSVLDALRRGIVFRTAEALDRASRVSTATFCARGTLLLGEPEVATVEPIGREDPAHVLSIVAGTESGSVQPTATAILRAARARGIRPDGVRNPNVVPGLGVTAVASNGQPVVVGSRGLMLKERISVAAAESRVTDLEAMGRSVILVGQGGRLIGVVGLQDGLRPGARAAVQHLLDVGVEPVLLSGDARETCEALGRAVDIEHIRPEVLPHERGQEIRRLSDGGITVAVLGRSPADDVALGAADVSVALAAAGASSAEWHVQLASDDVRDAAYAIRLAHRYRRDALAGLGLAALPGSVAALFMSIGLLPPSLVPLVALSGGVAAVFRVRSPR